MGKAEREADGWRRCRGVDRLAVGNQLTARSESRLREHFGGVPEFSWASVRVGTHVQLDG